MKIAVFTDTFYPSTNGIVTSIIAFSKELADNWNEVLIVTPYNKWIESFTYKNIEVFTIKWIPAIFYPDFKITFWFTPNLIKKIRTFKPDIIHFHTQFIIWWQAIIIWKMFKIPRIWTFHTYIADENYLKVIWLNSKIFWEMWWKYNNFFYKKIEKVIVPSTNAKIELINHWIDSKDIEIVSNPLPMISSNKEKYFLNKIKTENIVLYVWRISKEKNIDVCLESIYVVSKEVPDVLFVIVWDWPEKKDLQRHAKKIGIENNVLFLWKVPHGELLNSDIFDRAKLFLSASPSENQPLTLIEAMNFGLPIVWVDEKWVWELIEKNWFKAKNENFWELAIYIIKLLKDHDLCKKMWEESKKMSERFNLKELSKKLGNLYDKVIQEYKNKY